MASDDVSLVRAGDLVGCRYRLRQRLAHPEIPPLPEAVERQPQVDAGRAAVFGLLPERRALGDGRRKAFSRLTLDPALRVAEREARTRKAIKDRTTLIIDGALTGVVDGIAVLAEIDILVRQDDGTYLPVIVSNHRVARPSQTATMQFIPTHRLGLGKPLETAAKARHHTVDGYRVALAYLLLADAGLASPLGAVVGQDRERAYLGDAARYVEALREALAKPTPHRPLRLKQCASCRYWALCEPELKKMDDISLVFPGQKARPLRERGITTVEVTIAADLGETSQIARAWREGIPVLARTGVEPAPELRADVEIDVDMEAYLDQGAYLWGAFDGTDYRAFATWDEVGGADTDAEEENFLAFWTWLQSKRAAAHAGGKSFRAYCYAAGGENHWLTASARRFDSVDEAEVRAFIASDEWVDVFTHVRRHLVGTEGLGLKVVAPVAGFTWDDDDVDGERSVALRREARMGSAEAREMLVRYNGDDCRATAAVRHFLSAGAPGVPRLSSL
ncbi:TM0106 family RecB-like putative nuclease [Corynebacterium appendicis]|uniref:TM0106 family RecB-like putative nuclease n=1 Tax=Corynebacterium appendicis TaxID=163202 RepID=UPI00254ADECF|nr:TM0106 family RecB-like putative nuclease [Corynebacterium appendicis]MDK8626385.1 TM0106 family RecB-like putative nuclease [Corynebacterium appendicis]